MASFILQSIAGDHTIFPWAGRTSVGDSFSLYGRSWKRINENLAIENTPAPVKRVWTALDFFVHDIDNDRTDINNLYHLTSIEVPSNESRSSMQSDLYRDIGNHKRTMEWVYRALSRLKEAPLKLLTDISPAIKSYDDWSGVAGYADSKDFLTLEAIGYYKYTYSGAIIVPSFMSPGWVGGFWIVSKSKQEWVPLLPCAYSMTGLVVSPTRKSFNLIESPLELLRLSPGKLRCSTVVHKSSSGYGSPKLNSLVIQPSLEEAGRIVGLTEIAEEIKLTYDFNRISDKSIWEWLWHAVNRRWPAVDHRISSCPFISSVFSDLKIKNWFIGNYTATGHTNRATAIRTGFPVRKVWSVNGFQLVEYEEGYSLVHKNKEPETVTNFTITVEEITAYSGDEIFYKGYTENAKGKVPFDTRAFNLNKYGTAEAAFNQFNNTGNARVIYTPRAAALLKGVIQQQATSCTFIKGSSRLGYNTMSGEFVCPGIAVRSGSVRGCPVSPHTMAHDLYRSTDGRDVEDLPTLTDFYTRTFVAEFTGMYAKAMAGLFADPIILRDNDADEQLLCSAANALGQRRILSGVFSKREVASVADYPLVVYDYEKGNNAKHYRYPITKLSGEPGLVCVLGDSQENIERYLSGVVFKLLRADIFDNAQMDEWARLKNQELGKQIIRAIIDPKFSIGNTEGILDVLIAEWGSSELEQRSCIEFDKVVIDFLSHETLMGTFTNALIGEKLQHTVKGSYVSIHKNHFDLAFYNHTGRNARLVHSVVSLLSSQSSEAKEL